MSLEEGDVLDSVVETILGIDLGGGKGKNTAVAVVKREISHYIDEAPVYRGSVVFADTRNADCVPFYDDELVELLETHLSAGTLVAINAPLTVPACTRCVVERCPGVSSCVDRTVVVHSHLDSHINPAKSDPAAVLSIVSPRAKPEFTPYTQRVCERYLEQTTGIVCRESLGQGSGPITARAQHLRRIFGPTLTLNTNLIEVYPKATLHALFGETLAGSYKATVNIWDNRARLLELMSDHLTFTVWREGILKNDHCFDAVVSAYTGLLACNQTWTIPDQFVDIATLDGWIWSPLTMAACLEPVSKLPIF